MKASVGGYARAESTRHAVELLASAEGQGRILAGGQSLLAALNMRLSTEDLLVDISRLSELSGVVDTGETLKIGALTRHADIARSELVRMHAPLLSHAVCFVAHAAIRNRGTIGGALAHADPAAEFPACALVLGATLHVEGPGSTREIAAEDFFEDVFTTALADDEILVALSLPKREPAEIHVIEEVARRSGDYALAGLCLVKRPAGHRVALFSVADTPVLAPRCMAALDAGDIDSAVQALRLEISPPDDTQASAEYRRHLVGVLLRRAMARVAGDRS